MHKHVRNERPTQLIVDRYDGYTCIPQHLLQHHGRNFTYENEKSNKQTILHIHYIYTHTKSTIEIYTILYLNY